MKTYIKLDDDTFEEAETLEIKQSYSLRELRQLKKGLTAEMQKYKDELDKINALIVKAKELNLQDEDGTE